MKKQNVWKMGSLMDYADDISLIRLDGVFIHNEQTGSIEKVSWFDGQRAIEKAKGVTAQKWELHRSIIGSSELCQFSSTDSLEKWLTENYSKAQVNQIINGSAIVELDGVQHQLFKEWMDVPEKDLFYRD